MTDNAAREIKGRVARDDEDAVSPLYHIEPGHIDLDVMREPSALKGLAQEFARELRRDFQSCAQSPQTSIWQRSCGSGPPPWQRPMRTDPDLALVVENWDRLPEAIRSGIMAMIRAASKEAER
jgi:hypothetical protein